MSGLLFTYRYPGPPSQGLLIKNRGNNAIINAQMGMPQKFSPASGVTSNALLHALVSATIEECLARGMTPPVYVAANVDGGEEWNRKLWDEYGDRVFYV